MTWEADATEARRTWEANIAEARRSEVMRRTLIRTEYELSGALAAIVSRL
jgi:hypothetical protein